MNASDTRLQPTKRVPFSVYAYPRTSFGRASVNYNAITLAFKFPELADTRHVFTIIHCRMHLRIGFVIPIFPSFIKQSGTQTSNFFPLSQYYPDCRLTNKQKTFTHNVAYTAPIHR